jgi:hypothetical protein
VSIKQSLVKKLVLSAVVILVVLIFASKFMVPLNETGLRARPPAVANSHVSSALEAAKAKLKRARAVFPSEFSDIELEALLAMKLDLDDPAVVAKKIASKRFWNTPSYLLPITEARNYAHEIGTPNAYIMSAFAAGDKARSEVALELLNEASQIFGGNPQVLYAKLMANKNYLLDEDAVNQLRVLIPLSSLPDLMAGAAAASKGQWDEALKFYKIAATKQIGEFGLGFAAK